MIWSIDGEIVLQSYAPKYVRTLNGIARAAVLWVAGFACIASASPVQERIDRSIHAGEPVVVHVTVALADNKNQWIVPVPESIGNGQNPRTNLYWGARYGLKTFFIKDGGWRRVQAPGADNGKILERLVLQKRFERNGATVDVYLVADAWDGAYIEDTIQQFLRYGAGHDLETLKLSNDVELAAGGAAHAQVYIGHNALMDDRGARNPTIANPRRHENRAATGVIVLACKSDPYFRPRLEALDARPLVLTAGLMAPEAYTLDAALSAWVGGADDNDVRRAAAKAYAKYQKASIKAVERLFGVDDR